MEKGEIGMVTTQTISVLVKNQPGVLARIADLFSQRGWNIDQLTVNKYAETNISKMRILLTLDEVMLQHVIDQLEKSIDVIQVKVASRHVHDRILWNKLGNFVKSHISSAWIVAFSLFITLLGTNIPAPLYAIYRTQMNLSSGMVTLVFAAYALMVIPTIVISGQLSDHIGRKKVLITGVLFSILGSIGFLVANSIEILLLARLFQGISVGMLNGVAVAAMTELDPNQDKAKTAFIAAIAVTLGNAFGPVLSGFLGDYAPFPTKLSFIIHFLLAIPGMIGLFYIQEKTKPSLNPMKLHTPHIPKDIRKPFYLSSITSFIAWGIMSLLLSIIPSYLNTLVGNSNLTISGGIIALVLGISTVHQLMLRKRAIRTLIVTGYLFLGLGLAGIILTIMMKSLLFLIITTIVIGLGHGPAYAGSLSLINKVSPNSKRTGIVSSFFVVTYIGVSIPILLLGVMSELLGLTIAIQGFCIIMGAMLTISIFGWLRFKDDYK